MFLVSQLSAFEDDGNFYFVSFFQEVFRMFSFKFKVMNIGIGMKAYLFKYSYLLIFLLSFFLLLKLIIKLSKVDNFEYRTIS
jgi:hypothetical protein